VPWDRGNSGRVILQFAYKSSCQYPDRAACSLSPLSSAMAFRIVCRSNSPWKRSYSGCVPCHWRVLPPAPRDGRRQVRHLDHWSAGKGASPLQAVSSSRTLPPVMRQHQLKASSLRIFSCRMRRVARSIKMRPAGNILAALTQRGIRSSERSAGNRDRDGIARLQPAPAKRWSPPESSH